MHIAWLSYPDNTLTSLHCGTSHPPPPKDSVSLSQHQCKPLSPGPQQASRPRQPLKTFLHTYDSTAIPNGHPKRTGDD